jgi:hypothetical protein
MMKPILIFFYGDANIGKTSVLKKLGEWFRHRCIEYIELRDKSNSSDVKLAIKIDEESCRVGIGTGGDTPEIVIENLEFFLNSNYFKQGEFTVFITASRYAHTDKAYEKNPIMKKLLNRFSCIDIPRNFARKSRTWRDGAVSLVREDDLFVYLRTVIQKKKVLPFAFESKRGGK